MTPYIGTKIILAEPCMQRDFIEQHHPDWVMPAQDRPGYHVKYPQPDGTTYNSWSPADVFENAYREISENERKLIE